MYEKNLPKNIDLKKLTKKRKVSQSVSHKTRPETVPKNTPEPPQNLPKNLPKKDPNPENLLKKTDFVFDMFIGFLKKTLKTNLRIDEKLLASCYVEFLFIDEQTAMKLLCRVCVHR